MGIINHGVSSPEGRQLQGHKGNIIKIAKVYGVILEDEKANLLNGNKPQIQEQTEKIQEPIKWTGTKEQRAKTIDMLEGLNCIPPKRKYQIFTEHFQWLNPKTKKLENIDNKELSSLSGKTPLTRKKVKAITTAIKSGLSS